MRSSLINKVNVFGMSDFDSFLEHPDSKLLLRDLEAEIPQLATVLTMILKRFNETHFNPALISQLS